MDDDVVVLFQVIQLILHCSKLASNLTLALYNLAKEKKWASTEPIPQSTKAPPSIVKNY